MIGHQQVVVLADLVVAVPDDGILARDVALNAEMDGRAVGDGLGAAGEDDLEGAPVVLGKLAELFLAEVVVLANLVVASADDGAHLAGVARHAEMDERRAAPLAPATATAAAAGATGAAAPAEDGPGGLDETLGGEEVGALDERAEALGDADADDLGGGVGRAEVKVRGRAVLGVGVGDGRLGVGDIAFDARSDDHLDFAGEVEGELERGAVIGNGGEGEAAGRSRDTHGEERV